MDVLSDLHVFQEVVEAGSFVKAAQRLEMTPSGVSKRLSRYESRLGIRLLNRTTRSLSLTEAGESLYARGRMILAEVLLAEEASRNATAMPRGDLRVSCSDAFALEVLVPTLSLFHAQFPDVSVTVLQGDGPIDVVEERIDVAIRFERPTNSDFVAVPLVDDPWVVCASPSYLDHYGLPEEPVDLASHRCMTIRARDVERDKWEFNVGGEDRTVQVESVFSGIGAVVKAAALTGLGVARLARFLVRDDIIHGHLVELLGKYAPVSQRSIYVVYPHREFVPLKVRLLVEHLRTHFGT